MINAQFIRCDENNDHISFTCCADGQIKEVNELSYTHLPAGH